MSDIFGALLPIKSTTLIRIRRESRYFLIKHLLDITLTSILLILLSPLMAMIAILIKVDSRGPVLFKQKRVGARRVFKDNAWSWEVDEFFCLKFRTMIHHADPSLHQAYVTALIENDAKKLDELQPGDQPIRKLVHDPRITRIGHFLRKYSLDELPQFFNVLNGRMSLVGPRPAIKYEVDLYKPWHLARLRAMPGITGLQQVKARCTADFDDQVKFDLQYIENQSLWLDLKIMLLTPIEILRHRGAY